MQHLCRFGFDLGFQFSSIILVCLFLIFRRFCCCWYCCCCCCHCAIDMYVFKECPSILRSRGVQRVKFAAATVLAVAPTVVVVAATIVVVFVLQLLLLFLLLLLLLILLQLSSPLPTKWPAARVQRQGTEFLEFQRLLLELQRQVGWEATSIMHV